MKLKEALMNRRSVRRYKQESIPRDTLYEVAETARFAPSAGNRQEWELIVVDQPETAGAVFDTLAWLPEVGPPPEGQKPPAYMVIISDAQTDALADCASLTTYLLLAAYGKGLGSCWFGSIMRTQLADALGLPENYSVEYVVSMGYPAENLDTVNSREDRDVDVKNGVTEVPKRVLSDFLHVNKYGNKGE